MCRGGRGWCRAIISSSAEMCDHAIECLRTEIFWEEGGCLGVRNAREIKEGCYFICFSRGMSVWNFLGFMGGSWGNA